MKNKINAIQGSTRACPIFDATSPISAIKSAERQLAVEIQRDQKVLAGPFHAGGLGHARSLHCSSVSIAKNFAAATRLFNVSQQVLQ
jgi:hypothetical protein